MAQSFFLEPTTGESHPLDWEGYLGVESLWNHRNFWVNMQDCSQGVKVGVIPTLCLLNVLLALCTSRSMRLPPSFSSPLSLFPSPSPLPLLFQTLQYDLGDATKWEFFFPNVEKPLLVVPGEEIERGEEGEEGKVSQEIE